MAEISNVAMPQNVSSFQAEINLEKETVEGNHFFGYQNSKEALREQATTKLMVDLKRAEEHADREGWISAKELERELGRFNEENRF